MGNIETAAKFSRLKSISSIEDNYSFTINFFFFFFQLQSKTITLYCEENIR